MSAAGRAKLKCRRFVSAKFRCRVLYGVRPRILFACFWLLARNFVCSFLVVVVVVFCHTVVVVVVFSRSISEIFHNI